MLLLEERVVLPEERGGATVLLPVEERAVLLLEECSGDNRLKGRGERGREGKRREKGEEKELQNYK